MAVEHSITASQSASDVVSDTDVQRELPRLILAFECRQPSASTARLVLTAVDEVVLGRGVSRSWRRHGRQLEISLADHETSRRHASIKRHEDGWELTDLRSKNGTLVNGINVVRALLADGDIIEVGGTIFVYRDEIQGTQPIVDLDLTTTTTLPPAFRTLNPELEDCANKLQKIAPSNVPVLIRGETGTGKELTAEAIHQLSGRTGAFVPVNCGAIPRELIESELFGHKRGAFSGARDSSEGLVRRADGGTLLLDEIAELPEESQVSLLRVLQEGEVRPLGSTHIVNVDVRIIAATHKDLGALVATGSFRKDLYSRLLGYEVELPPLRKRREDTGTLLGALLARISGSHTVTLDKQAARAVMLYPYPLNIRELEQALRSAVPLADNGEIRIEHLPASIRSYRPHDAALLPEDEALRTRLAELLSKHRGNVAAVGRAFHKAPMQVRRWCQRLSLDIASFRD